MSAEPPPVFTMRGLHPEMLETAIFGAHIDPCQLSARPVLSDLARLVCPGACLDYAALGPALFFHGEMTQAGYTLVFVLETQKPGLSVNFSMEHTDGYIGFFPPGGIMEAMTPEDYATATLTVPTAEFHTAVALHFPEMPEEILAHGAPLRLGPVENARLRDLLLSIRETLWKAPQTYFPLRARRDVERQLLFAFLDAVRSGCAHFIPPPTQRVGGRLRRFRQAREYLEAHADRHVYLEDLGAAIGLTPRGVETLFHDLLGVSPMRYLHHRRLHGVRRALIQAAPAPGAVKHAALDWGFLHQGRFARDYRTLFGEGPAETLARR